MPAQLIQCPRCGESLPVGLPRCDSCGAYLVPAPAPPARAPIPAQPRGQAGHPQSRGAPAPKAKRPGGPRREVPGVAYLLLVSGLVVGGLVGYTLRGSIGPREEGGEPTGPADLMAGGMGAPGGAMGDGGGAMPAEMMRRIQEYRAALQRDPDDVHANVGLGNLLFDSSQWNGAIEHYTKALEREPGNPDVRVDRAIAYHNLGQDQQAAAEMERVTKEHPTHKNAWLNLGVVSAGMGDRATAVRAWEQFLKLEPNGERSAGIREELAQLKRP